MEIKKINVVVEIKTNNNKCFIHKKQYDHHPFFESNESCRFNGKRTYEQPPAMHLPSVEVWHVDYCKLFHKKLELDSNGYPYRCKECLESK